MLAVGESARQYGDRGHQAECNPLGRHPAYGSDMDPEGQDKSLGFCNASIRRGFMRKVYLIVVAQLITSLVFIVGFNNDMRVRQMMTENPLFFLSALFTGLAVLLILACNESFRRRTPTNFIFLVAFTIAESILLGVASCRCAPREILLAVVIATAVCLGLAFFALQTRYDFTLMGGMLMSYLLVQLLFWIVTVFAGYGLTTTIYACLSALLFSLYLVYDTHLMMGGRHRCSIGPEEYIFAALNLYTDVINVFMDILKVLGGSD
ncbi:protein lifeguard 1 [Drosophila biarmipes]|uniref:protein lifeguard 1 n=1 Tax=Drosophila biarmipes TaxID=125945 RepID=UPI0007E688AF|nr:protein lifeguard 1 [Drosophila biarmipes]